MKIPTTFSILQPYPPTRFGHCVTRSDLLLLPSLTLFHLSLAINRLSKEHFRAWSLSNPTKHQALHICTSLHSLYKIQFDAAVRSNFSVAGTVCLDQNNEIIVAQTKYLPAVIDPLCEKLWHVNLLCPSAFLWN